MQSNQVDWLAMQAGASFRDLLRRRRNTVLLLGAVAGAQAIPVDATSRVGLRAPLVSLRNPTSRSPTRVWVVSVENTNPLARYTLMAQRKQIHIFTLP
jgi:hypothetical protein